jgi:hypothetical protein
MTKHRHLPAASLTIVTSIALISSAVLAQASSSANHPAPKERDLSSKPTCPTCRIRMERVVSFGDDDGEGFIADRPYAIRRDSRGRYYTIGRFKSDRVPAVYDSTGKFLRHIGRVGRGPGEFLGASAMLIQGDSLFVFDSGNRRLTVLSPSYEPVRSAPIPWTASAAFANRDIVLNAEVADRVRISLVLHHIDRVGNYIGSFGDPKVRVTLKERPAVRWLASARTGGVWSVWASKRYVIRKWNIDGTKVMELSRDASWFQPYDRPWMPTPDRPPAPSIAAIWQAPDGLLWVIGLAADPHWADGLGSGVRAEGRVMYPWIDNARIYDSMVEVIDPRTGTLVTTARFDQPIELAIGDGLFSTLAEDSRGAPRVTVWRLTLAGSYNPTRENTP